MRVVQGSREPLRRTRAAGSGPCSLGDLDELRDMKDPGYFRRPSAPDDDLELETAAIRHPELLPSRSI